MKGVAMGNNQAKTATNGSSGPPSATFDDPYKEIARLKGELEKAKGTITFLETHRAGNAAATGQSPREQELERDLKKVRGELVEKGDRLRRQAARAEAAEKSFKEVATERDLLQSRSDRLTGQLETNESVAATREKALQEALATAQTRAQELERRLRVSEAETRRLAEVEIGLHQEIASERERYASLEAQLAATGREAELERQLREATTPWGLEDFISEHVGLTGPEKKIIKPRFTTFAYAVSLTRAEFEALPLTEGTKTEIKTAMNRRHLRFTEEDA